MEEGQLCCPDDWGVGLGGVKPLPVREKRSKLSGPPCKGEPGERRDDEREGIPPVRNPGGARWPVPASAGTEPDRRRLPLDEHPGQRALLPLETVFSVFSRLFRAFPSFRRIQAALPYPPNRSAQNAQNTRNTLVYGFSSLPAPLVPLDPDR